LHIFCAAAAFWALCASDYDNDNWRIAAKLRLFTKGRLAGSETQQSNSFQFSKIEQSYFGTSFVR